MPQSSRCTGAKKALSWIANIRAALQHVKDTAEQFKSIDRWAVLLRYVSDKIAPTLGTFKPPEVLAATG